ncbi:DUF4163 domain-containing protein [Paenibacillus sp. IHB B 3084]|uniref:DUF4163 domain-containing protein n=1 Tax=Paenibacillus sp. IHB B 3084 TaxID=867076 RepID=UPI000AD1C377|nr:DUF4163 domain-containing protein [Paenibacillus sp. IHB B 3084]
MIRIHYKKIAFIILVLMIMASCGKVPKDVSSIHVENNKGNDAYNQQNYELIQAKYSENGIIIKYPQITKLKDAVKQKSLNQILKTEAVKGLHEYADSDTEVHVEIDYEIKRQSERFLSIQYTGIRYVKDAAYPNHIFYTTNLDMKQALRLRLSDL